MPKLKDHHSHLIQLRRELSGGRLDRRGFVRIATLLGIGATAAYSMAGLVAPSVATAQGQPRKGGRLRLALRLGDISDPHTYSWGQDMFARSALEQLTITGVDNVTRPLLLERWEASADLKTWTLHLRKDVKWMSGREFVADDVIWNLKRALDPATGSATVGLFSGFLLEQYQSGGTDASGKPKTSQRLWDANAIERVDSHTVRLNGRNPLLAVPEHLYHKQLFIMDPEDGGVFKAGSNVTGPYEIVEYRQGQRCLMKARADYWGGGPYIQELELIDLGDDPNAHLAALASNQIDGWPWLDNVTLDAARRLPNVAVYEAQTANTGAARMRVTEKPFDDPRVRKAMRLAIDNTAILKLGLGGLGYEGEHHLVAKVHPDYAKVEPLKRDIAQAKRLLAEAGHPDGIDAKIYLKASPAWEGQVVQSMIEQWKEAGIRVQMNPVPAAQYWEIWKKVPLGFTDWNHRPLGIMLLGLCFRDGGAWNESGYSNAEFDQILIKAEGTLDAEKRREYIAQLEKILLEDGPIVQPIYRSIFSAYSKKLKNFKMHPTNYNYYKDYWIEES
ncbi:MAG: ABC transporter substrate-binding protein [Proteobacteria bacterium]|nr:ABC transporter substrate-binding protein [Pseudomonadota bacterium]